MIKNQLYPYIEKYVNELLYGFTKEQFNVGVMNGMIKLEKLNLRPDGANKILDDKNFAFWLKAGFITKIYIGCSIMNFIGEKPLDVEIEDVDIILTPSYKWIIKNIDSFIIENGKQMREPYDPNENNSMDIFERKVNVVDNSIFKKELILEIFKDGTKISQLINNLFKYCFKFYYMKNFLVNAKIKNIHIRFEDDQLINYNGNIALGIKADSLDIILSSEGVMKKDLFKINNLNIYWESNAKILIPSELLTDSIINGELSEKYYDNLKKLKFKNFNYIEGTKFILQNFNCNGKMGTISISSGKIDLFGKRDNSFKMYAQFSSNELNINIYPDLLNIYTNYKKFMNEFNVLEQVQDFKPMRKPYDRKNAIFKDMYKKILENKNSSFTKLFLYKKKMLVRDWLYYFYWCQKCKSAIYTRAVNPLRLEFSRFYGICFNQWEDSNVDELKKMNEKKKENEELNPDNVILFLKGDFLIKGLNINFHSGIKNNDNNYISAKMGGIELKINSSQNQFDINTNVKNITLFPNKIIIGEGFIINSNIRKREQNPIKTQNNLINNMEQNRYIPLYDIEENTGLVGLVKKYNPNYEQKIKIIDNALDKISTKSRAESRAVSEVDYSEITPKFNLLKNTNIHNNTHKLEYNSSNILNSDFKQQRSPFKLSSNNNININNYTYQMPKNNSFAKQIISNYEATPSIQKMELKKQKNEFSISQAINEYNSRKSRERISIKSNKNPSPQITGIIFSNKKNINNINNININNNIITNQIISTGKNIPINLLEINSNNNSKSFIFRYIKNNDNKLIDNLFIQFGTIRFNFFSDYISTYLNILSEYKKVLNQPIIHSLQIIDNGIKMQKELYKLKKYIYNYIKKIPDKKNTEQIDEYKKYLKKELDKAILLGVETDNFDINYLMSFFPKGFDINFDYDSIECVYYGNEKKVCGKGIIPPSEFQFRIDENMMKVKFFDFEFEINDLTNAKFLMSKIMKILEEKLNMTKLFIEPCISQLREDLNKTNRKNEKKNNEKNKQLENMFLLAQDNIHKKEIKQNDEDIVNYNNMMESKDNNTNINNNNNNIVIKEYKYPKSYEQTVQENEEEEINDLNNDELNKIGNISIKESKITNNFYNNLIEDNKDNKDNIDKHSKPNFNQNDFIPLHNKITYQKKNSPKNNLPKVNKK